MGIYYPKRVRFDMFPYKCFNHSTGTGVICFFFIKFDTDIP